MVPILPRLSPFFPAEGVAAPLSRGIRDEFGPFISLASFSFITCFVHLPSQNLFALTLSPPSLFSPCSLPLCPSDPPPLRRTATPLLFSVSGITIRGIENLKHKFIQKLYTKLQEGGWLLILFSSKLENQRNAITEHLIPAGYGAWSSMIMRLGEEL
ncbi:hypothetical protein RHMOL_Rhmol12G0034600 [Rhododendron molle]|uniref:Uncharacterized protein n=2 Tax=Rhododendron molle TaxID=49168 RepID=A0ACC0LDT2_RHOML|nr:hypothetical protein RHMOL_Rhmol12G0034600 [Rhododendron molle]KAI8526900.1 hypothetical protein RHMOL_Rhmol12G0034600 [Rhododendron molle]